MPEIPNIKLDYPLRVGVGLGDDLTYHFASTGAEFFVDEHGHQWVKFVATYGYNPGHEHMLRTDSVGFVIIRDDDK